MLFRSAALLLTWLLPTHYVDGSALEPADYLGTRVYITETATGNVRSVVVAGEAWAYPLGPGVWCFVLQAWVRPPGGIILKSDQTDPVCALVRDPECRGCH